MWRGRPFGKLRTGSRPRRVSADAPLYENSICSGHYGDSDPRSWVPRIKQEIPAVNEIDIAMVGVGPSSRPGLPDFESVPAIREARMTRHHSYVADSKVVLASKMGTKMFVRNLP